MSPEPAARPPMSEFGRITNVYLEPKAAFADIAARPRPWVPLVLIAVASMVYMAVFAQRVGWERMMEQQLERSSQAASMTSDQRAKATEMYGKMGAVMDKAMVAAPVLLVPLYTLIVAGFLALIFRVMLAADVSFRQLFAVSSYASLPDLLFHAAAIAVLFLKNPDEFNFENPVAFNVGAFLDPQTTSKALMSVASSIDAFTFWKLALLATGISIAARRITFGRALAGVCAPWLLWVVLKTGIAALRG